MFVGEPTLVTFLHRTARIEWCVLKCGSKNTHQKIMCAKEIG